MFRSGRPAPFARDGPGRVGGVQWTTRKSFRRGGMRVFRPYVGPVGGWWDSILVEGTSREGSDEEFRRREGAEDGPEG